MPKNMYKKTKPKKTTPKKKPKAKKKPNKTPKPSPNLLGGSAYLAAKALKKSRNARDSQLNKIMKQMGK